MGRMFDPRFFMGPVFFELSDSPRSLYSPELREKSDSKRILSVGQQHELVMALEKAGILPLEAQAIIGNSDIAREVIKLLSKKVKDKKALYERLFLDQIATLKDRGTPEQIVEILQNQKGSVLKKASEMAIGDGNIPFLPVIPRSFRSPYDLMAMVRNGGKVGYTYLNPTQISDVVDAPQELYYIYDVEDGNSTCGKSPENAEKIFKQQKRSPLTVAEIMALTVQADVFSKHYVWALGSRFESVDRVPYVYLVGDGRPMLDWDHVAYSVGHWGSASCGSR